MSGKFDAIVRDAGAFYPLLKKPFHRFAAFEVHGGSHDRFHLAAQILGTEAAVRVPGDQGVEQSVEAGVGVGSGLTQHFAEHVNDPGAFSVNDIVVGVGRF